jgi:uncharacterized protein (TIGR03083 family)
MSTTSAHRGALVPALGRTEASALAETEYARFLSLVTGLEASDWTKRTDCPLWDVRAMVAHVLGAMEANASLREFIHQAWAGKRCARGGPLVDGISEVQVADRRDLSPADLVSRLASAAPRAVRARRRLPEPARRIPMKVEFGGAVETWSLGYLYTTIYTRDTWMHRVDIARATGRPLELTAEHDGRIVADVAAEWLRRHGRPVSLELTGPAGGTFHQGAEVESIRLDAVEFCRTLSGRAAGGGLLGVQVPF